MSSGAVEYISSMKYMGFGIGGLDDAGVPLQPSESQTALFNEAAVYPITRIEYPLEPNTKARYTCAIPAQDLSGVVISEACIKDGDNNVYHIATFLGKAKDGGVTFEFQFDVDF